MKKFFVVLLSLCFIFGSIATVFGEKEWTFEGKFNPEDLKDTSKWKLLTMFPCPGNSPDVHGIFKSLAPDSPYKGVEAVFIETSAGVAMIAYSYYEDGYILSYKASQDGSNTFKLVAKDKAADGDPFEKLIEMLEKGEPLPGMPNQNTPLPPAKPKGKSATDLLKDF